MLIKRSILDASMGPELVSVGGYNTVLKIQTDHVSDSKQKIHHFNNFVNGFSKASLQNI